MNPINESLRILKNREKELSIELGKIKNAISALEKSSTMRVFKKLTNIKCEKPDCGKMFQSKRSDSRFCSNACRNSHNYTKRIKGEKKKSTVLLKGDPLKSASSRA